MLMCPWGVCVCHASYFLASLMIFVLQGIFRLSKEDWTL